jgi:hypothetical protein
MRVQLVLEKKKIAELEQYVLENNQLGGFIVKSDFKLCLH